MQNQRIIVGKLVHGLKNFKVRRRFGGSEIIMPTMEDFIHMAP